MQWVFTFNAVGAAIPFALFRNTFWVSSCDRACCAASEAWPSPRAPRGLTVASGKCPDLKRMKSQLQTIFHVSYHALPYRCTCVFTIHFGGSWNWFYITEFRWKCILFWKSDIWNFQNWLDGSMKNIFSLSDSRHCTSYGRESCTGGGWGGMGVIFSTGMNLCRILIYHDFRFWICLIDRVSVSAPTLTQIESQVRPLRNPLRWCTLSLRLESTQGLPLNLLSSRPYIYSSAGYQQELSDCSINRQQFVFQIK